MGKNFTGESSVQLSTIAVGVRTLSHATPNRENMRRAAFSAHPAPPSRISSVYPSPDAASRRTVPPISTEPSADSSAVWSASLNPPAACGSQANPTSASLRGVAGIGIFSDRPSRQASGSASRAAS